MEAFLLSLVNGVTGGVFSYILVFAILLACGLGIPLPEDVSLILGGFLVYSGKAYLPLMMATGYLGIIIGDSMIFIAGRRIGSKVGQKKGGFFSRIVTPEKRARVELLFKKHGEKIIMIARFLPGVRSVTYFTAGSVGMKWSHFVFFDSIAALASAPIFVFLGYKFGGELDMLIQQIRKGQRGVLIAMLAVFIVGFVVYRWRAQREKKLDERRRIGSKVGQKQGGFFSRIVTPEKRARVELLFKKHGEKIIMIARFLPGVRSVTYFTAGSVGMKWSHFVFFDSIAALASAPIFVFLGYKFGGELDMLIQQIRKGQRGVLIAMVAVFIVGFVVYRWRAQREKKLDEEALRLAEAQALHSGAGTPDAMAPAPVDQSRVS